MKDFEIQSELQGKIEIDQISSGRGVLEPLADPGLRGKTTSPSLECVSADNLLDHADSETLLEPAELAVVSPPLVHGTVLVPYTDVLGIGVLLNSSLEEALAALAGSHAVVLARGVVPAYGTQQRW